MEVVVDMNIPKLRGKIFLFINTVKFVNGIFHHRGTRLRKGYGAAGEFTEGFAFFAYRPPARRGDPPSECGAGLMGKKNTAI